MRYNVRMMDGDMYKVDCDWVDFDNPRWIAFMNSAKRAGDASELVSIFREEKVISVAISE